VSTTEAASKEETPAALRVEAPPAGWQAILQRILEYDFTRPLPFLALAIVYLSIRIPWLNLGYGTDPDAWRVALSAEHLLSHGEYLPSRLPGFPLHEFATVPLIRAGWVWTNLSTAVVSLVGVYLFAKLVAELNLRGRGLLSLTFAFAPLLWINSVITLDYMWALTFILASYWLAIRQRPALSGVALGLALGFRLTSGAMALPLGFLLWREKGRRDTTVFAIALAAVSVVAYLPVLATYGLSMFNFYDASLPWHIVLNRLAKDGLGVVGALAVLVGLALSARNLRNLPTDLRQDTHVLVWVAAILLYFVSFLQLPHEIAYLIPVFPFGLFFLSRYLRKGVLAAVAAVIILAGFVDVTSPGDSLNLDTFAEARIGPGMLFSDLDTLQSQMDFADEVRDYDVPPHSVVLTGFIYPEFAILNKDRLKLGILDRDYQAISMLSDQGEAVDEEQDIHYVWLISYEKFLDYREQGYALYFVPDAARSASAVFGYRPGYFGTMMKVAEERPATGKGAAPTDR
jgi:hypothetical protein